MKKRMMLLCAALAAFAAAGPPALLAQGPAVPCTISWNVDADGAWTNAANWNLGRVPGPGDDVCIDRPAGSFTVTLSSGAFSINSLHSAESFVLSGGTLSLGAASEIAQTFTLSGGTLTGAGSLAVQGAMSWTGGLMSGSGTTMVAPGAVLTLSGGNARFLSARKLTNAGTVTWTGAG